LSSYRFFVTLVSSVPATLPPVFLPVVAIVIVAPIPVSVPMQSLRLIDPHIIDPPIAIPIDQFRQGKSVLTHLHYPSTRTERDPARNRVAVIAGPVPPSTYVPVELAPEQVDHDPGAKLDA
jgi:hypothetical protein